MPLPQGGAETPAPKPSPKPHVGYLTCRKDGLTGTQGAGYDYIVAGNGLFVQAANELLTVRTLMAPARVRGLLEVEPKAEPAHGRIPAKLFKLGLLWMKIDPQTERFFAIRWNGKEYGLEMPEQIGTPASLAYESNQPGGTIAEFHSHGRLPAFFSSTDDRDEQGFRVYGVVGKTERDRPELTLRTGIYGHHAPAFWTDIFEGPCPCREPERPSWAGEEPEYEARHTTAEQILRAMKGGAFP